MRTGAGSHPPFARENPPPRSAATAPRKAGGSGGVPGWPVGLLGQWVASRWGRGRPPVRRPLSAGGGSGGVGGQRLHMAKSVLGSRRWPVGGWEPVASRRSGAGRRRPRPIVASGGGKGPPGWPVRGGAKASRLWPPLCGQWEASEVCGSPLAIGGREVGGWSSRVAIGSPSRPFVQSGPPFWPVGGLPGWPVSGQ